MKYNEELANLDNIEILGYEIEITSISDVLNQVDSINAECKTIQLMNADAIAGKKHLEHGIVHGIKAFERGENLAKDLGIEILLRTSGQRQISKAFKILGLKEGKMNVVIVIIDCSNKIIGELNSMFYRNDDVLDIDESKLKEIYSIDDKMINEHMSLTDILIDKTTKLIVDN